MCVKALWLDSHEGFPSHIWEWNHSTRKGIHCFKPHLIINSVISAGITSVPLLLSGGTTKILHSEKPIGTPYNKPTICQEPFEEWHPGMKGYQKCDTCGKEGRWRSMFPKKNWQARRREKGHAAAGYHIRAWYIQLAPQHSTYTTIITPSTRYLTLSIRWQLGIRTEGDEFSRNTNLTPSAPRELCRAACVISKPNPIMQEDVDLDKQCDTWLKSKHHCWERSALAAKIPA